MMALIEYRRARIPRFVTVEWIEESWQEKTLLDEERKLIRCPMQSSFPKLTDYSEPQVSHHTEELPHDCATRLGFIEFAQDFWAFPRLKSFE